MLTAPLAFAQQDAPVDDDGTIVISAARPRGSVDTDVPPVQELDAGDIASYGANSIEDLVAALAPQTGSGRGRGGGRPVILLNGRRISGFREIRAIPPEAISRVEIFPEEVALQYGFRPDQRVINFIITDGFTSVVVEAEHGEATDGGRGQSEFEGTFTRIGDKSRLVVDLEYQPATALRESERAIVQPDNPDGVLTVASDPADEGAFRTLLPSTDQFQVNASYAYNIGADTSLSVNGTYTSQNNDSLFGLNDPVFTVPASSPFAPNGVAADVQRFLLTPRPLTQRSESDIYQAAFSLNGRVGGWRWDLTGDYNRTELLTLTDRNADVRALQSAISAGTLDPFAPDLGASLSGPGIDTARSTNEVVTAKGTLAGTLLELPAGPVSATLSADYVDRSLDSSSDSATGFVSASLGRTEAAGSINFDVPISERFTGGIGALGDIALNGNFGYRDVNDFGGLIEYGYGVRWSPAVPLTLQFTFIGEEVAPDIGQLGNPQIVTPNVPIFDFTNNETVLATVITGGNPLLSGERRRDIKISATYEPEWLEGTNFIAEFFRNRSYDTTASFPTLTPEIEAAFPDRIVRDNDGALVSVDRRPVNFARVESDSLRYGINFSKSFGEQRGGRGGRGGGGFGGEGRRSRFGDGPRAGETPASAEPQPRAEIRPGEPGPPPEGQAAPQGNAGERQPQGGEGRAPAENQGQRGPGGGGRGPGFGPFGGGDGGRWNISIFHRIRFNETVLIAPGVPELDLLNGSSIGGSGGTPRHEIELEGGWFRNGLGIRATGNFKSATTVDGSATGGSVLDFSEIATLDLRLFFNFDNRPRIIEDFGFLKGSRIALRIDNIFNARQDVTDANGVTPLRFQDGFVDPLGRYVEISFRKRF